ncbi:MAG TPA: 50S ribosomal protein L10 [Candidatus Baltobacteraceae bacterium]|nr:50S ribosomal protein L10 [Candidatus Baltobacteraceae bacterium]
MLNKSQKVTFAKDEAKAIDKFKVVGIVPIAGIPDRLFQATKNKMKPNARFIFARQTVLKRILEGNPKTKHMASLLNDQSVILLSNDDPFQIYKEFQSNIIKLEAKPNQIAPDDINIESGETSIQPGQAVTELKAAGIDVQIQKGKVVIAKDKTLVAKGQVISLAVSKALHTLGVMPFSAVIEPAVMLSDGMMYKKEVLRINTESTTKEILVGFANALALSIDRGYVNQYTVERLLVKAYNNAMWLGVETKMPVAGIIEKLVANASLGAAALGELKPSE